METILIVAAQKNTNVETKYSGQGFLLVDGIGPIERLGSVCVPRVSTVRGGPDRLIFTTSRSRRLRSSCVDWHQV
jgi:hypothetical protein